MAFFIRDDRELPSWRGHGDPIRSQKSTILRDEDGVPTFIHAATTAMHDDCAYAHVPGMPDREGPYTPEKSEQTWAAREAFEQQFGPGHALCWAPVYSTDEAKAPACHFCGDPVLGRG